mmetsp:Transcript_92884/g.170392  ORF Transcript_92884/g.170392 Transcript_92884/m.170392 type:complete len:102 (+) Transcript_92884:420-725(+)
MGYSAWDTKIVKGPLTGWPSSEDSDLQPTSGLGRKGEALSERTKLRQQPALWKRSQVNSAAVSAQLLARRRLTDTSPMDPKFHDCDIKKKQKRVPAATTKS